MAALTVRPMEAGDLGRVSELSAQLGYPATPADLKRRYAELSPSPDHVLLVAVAEEGRIAGWIHARWERPLESEFVVEISGLVVDAAARRLGAGRALVAGVERWTRDKGGRRLRVRSNVLRDEAHRFYPSVGFVLKKTQQVYDRDLR